MRALLAAACCCDDEQVPSNCSLAWLDLCPEYMKVTLPGVRFESETEVCVPTGIQRWAIGPPGFETPQWGTSPFDAGIIVRRSQFTVSVRDILFRKQISCEWPGCPIGAPNYVEYLPVPDREQTGKLQIDESSYVRGTFAGENNGSPIPEATDTTIGSASIILKGDDYEKLTFGSVYNSSIRVFQLPATGEEPARCVVQLNLFVSGNALGAGTINVSAKTLPYPNGKSGCVDVSYEESINLSATLDYKETWSPINLADFSRCPSDLTVPSVGTYYNQIGATETRSEESPCDDYDFSCCCGNGCLSSARGCIARSRATGLGKAVIVGTNNP